MQYREREPTGVDEVLSRYLGQKGYLRQSREVLAAVLWAEVVGPWYARHTTVMQVSDGVMTIHCDSAPRAQQLKADSEKILERLNRRVAEYLAAGRAGRKTEVGAEPEAPRFIRDLRTTSAYSGRADPGRYRPSAAEAPELPTPQELEAYPLTAREEEEVEALVAEIEDELLRRRFAAAMRSRLRLQRWQRTHGWRPCPECGCLLAPGEDRCLACHPPEPPDQVRY